MQTIWAAATVLEGACEGLERPESISSICVNNHVGFAGWVCRLGLPVGFAGWVWYGDIRYTCVPHQRPTLPPATSHAISSSFLFKF